MLRAGRHWAQDKTGKIPRPKFEQIKFDIPELEDEQAGTSVEIHIGNAPGVRPKRLDWQNAFSISS